MPRRKPKALKSSSPEQEGSSESDQPQLREEECKQPGAESLDDVSGDGGEAGQLPTAKRLKDEKEPVEGLTVKNKAKSKSKVGSEEKKPSIQAKQEELFEEKPRTRGKKKAVSKGEEKSSPVKLEAEEELLEEKPRAQTQSKKKTVAKVEPGSQEKLEVEEELLKEKPRARGKKAVAEGEEEEEDKRPVKHAKPENEDSAAIQSMPDDVQKAVKKKGKGKAVAKVPDSGKGQTGEKTVQGGATKASQRQYWLMKSEPESRLQKGVDMKFSIEDLQSEPNQTTCWDGVRNYQARNFMRDAMRVGDLAFFYHSNCKDPGITGIIEIIREGYVDHTQFNPSDPHYDPKSTPEDAKWFMVDVKFVRHLKRFIPLSELRALRRDHAKSGGALAGMALFTMGRLSVQPVTKEEFDFIVSLEEKTP